MLIKLKQTTSKGNKHKPTQVLKSSALLYKSISKVPCLSMRESLISEYGLCWHKITKSSSFDKVILDSAHLSTQLKIIPIPSFTWPITQFKNIPHSTIKSREIKCTCQIWKITCLNKIIINYKRKSDRSFGFHWLLQEEK